MLAAECKAPGMFGALYADSLTVAILVGLMRLGSGGEATRQRYRLAPWQLRAATECDSGQRHTALRSFARTLDPRSNS